MKTKLLLPVVVLATLVACQKDIREQNTTPLSTRATDHQLPLGGNYVANELLIKFKPGFAESEKLQVLKSISGSITEKIFTKAMQQFGEKESIYLVHTPAAVADAIKQMQLQKMVEYAEPNYRYQHDVVSNDPYYQDGSLWGMYGDASTPSNQYGCQAAEAWANGHTGSQSVFVGVVDEGAMFAHEDLFANFWVNPFDQADGIDNDGNGFVDDVHGWDFVNNDKSVFDGTVDDHGTHVSGTIGAKGRNSKGVAGVNWKVQLISAKFLGSSGGTTANAIKAIDYVTDLKTRHGLNLVATNNSWGGAGFSQGLEDAITRAGVADILFVASAGNDGNNIDATPYYPAAYPNTNIICVAAISNVGSLASWSNYGAASVDIGAPGVNIRSTLPALSSGKVVSSYGYYSGTSMAAPHVTGAAALYASTHPGSSAATIKAAILNSAVATTSLSGKTFTGGRLNVSGF